MRNAGVAGYPGYTAFDQFQNEDYIGASGDAAEVFLRLIGVTLGSRRLLLDKYRRVAAKKKIGDYVRSNAPAVQRTLPKNKHGVLMPDVDVPHTQLGRSTPSHGAEPQAREWMFDSQGRLVPTRDIDFTDHNFPKIHPDPHQHILTPTNPNNPVGGGFHRSAPMPLIFP